MIGILLAAMTGTTGGRTQPAALLRVLLLALLPALRAIPAFEILPMTSGKTGAATKSLVAQHLALLLALPISARLELILKLAKRPVPLSELAQVIPTATASLRILPLNGALNGESIDPAIKPAKSTMPSTAF
jgi:hypothetical protein